MEEQHTGDSIRDVDAISDTVSSTTLSSSELTLRFPRPQGNRHLASWISSSTPDIMNPSTVPGDGDLVESSYEFINTDDDVESQDDRATETTEAESLSSFDYARPDDVHSLDGIERTDTEDEDDDEDEDDVAEYRSRTSSIQYAEQSLMSPSSRVATPLLEYASSFETQHPTCVKPVEVKHVTHHFKEPNPRQISSISVRRTMAQSCLYTQVPFRILYNGDLSAEDDIIGKFLSALAVSTPKDDFSPKCLTVHSYDAKVISIPHVAVFYVTKEDDEKTQNNREAAWTLMHQHAVPCIFVSDTELFRQLTETWNDRIDPYVIHQFVEFSDPDLEPFRLPIDLKSFKEIDDRQLNYNLAYLTGLTKTADKSQSSKYMELCDHSKKQARTFSQYVVSKSEDLNVWTATQLFGFCFIVTAVLLLGNWHMGDSSTAMPAPSTPTPSSVMSTTPVSVSTSTIINLTSSTTRAPQLKNSQSSAIAPFAELADFIADRFPDSQKGSVCTAEKYSRNEVLIKIPSSTKTSWLAKGSISIRALKGDRPLMTKLSSIDEGIIIEIPKKEAHGVLIIAIDTTRKPKVNETFSLDFGKTVLEQCLGYGKSITDAFHDAAQHRAEQVMALASLKNSVADDIREVSIRISEDAAKTANYVKASWNSAALGKTFNGLRHSRQTQDTLDWLDIKHKTAQIQSWLWWLKMTQQTEKHDNYLLKAKKYMSDKKLAVEKASKERLDKERMELRARRKKERLEARCQSGLSRWTQQCKQKA